MTDRERPAYYSDEEWSDYLRGKAEAAEKSPKKRKRKADGNGATHDDGFVHGDGGQILKGNHQNVRHALEQLGVKLKHDEFSNQPRIWGLPDTAPGAELTDALAKRLRFLIEELFGFMPGKDMFEDVLIDLAHLNRFHPVREWLDSKTWDRVPRIDNWLRDYGGADDTPFNRAVGRIFLLAAVRRVRQPGVKFDTMIVFEGEQGRNKSQALEILATRPDWFADHLPLGVDPKVVIEQCRGSWVVECAELKGLTREIDRIKAFLSTQRDKARAAYGRRSETIPRQFVLGGTTNDREWLNGDERRFWPVAIEKFDLDALRRDCEQLWAEAAHYEADGELITLQEDLWGAASEVRASRTSENPYQGKLSESFSRSVLVTSERVWEALGIPAEKRPAAGKYVGMAMRAIGFLRKRARSDCDVERGSVVIKLKRDDWYYERGGNDGNNEE